MPDQAAFREAHRKYDSAHKEFVQLMQDVIAGRDVASREELMDKARDIQTLHASFMKAAEPFVGWRK